MFKKISNGIKNNKRSDNLIRKIILVIKEISKNPGKYKNASQIRAMNFDTNIFIRKIKNSFYKV